MRGSTIRAGAALLLLGLLLPGCRCGDAPEPPDDPTWRVYAIEYGQTARFRRATLLADAHRDEKSRISWQAWLIRGKDRILLVDTGFADPAVAKKWRVEGFRTVPAALAELQVTPEQITDVLISHLHWDHVGNLAPFSRAKVWVQQREYDWARKRVSVEKPERGGIRLKDIEQLDRAKGEGRLQLIGPDTEIAPGIFTHDGGKHTKTTQWFEIRTGGRAGTIVLASDTAYLDENVERGVPSGSTGDAEQDRRALERMTQVASKPGLVIPGHEPEVLVRFRQVADGIVEIW